MLGFFYLKIHLKVNHMNKVIGWTMLISVFAIMFLMMAFEKGFLYALTVWFFAIISAIVVIVAVKLIV